MRSLIIGITGFSGSHLAEYLTNKGYEVFGTTRDTGSLNNIKRIADRIKLVQCDLFDEGSILKALEKCRPDQVFLLAAANQFQSTSEIFNTNVKGTLSFFESLVQLRYRGRVLVSSSSAVYGVQSNVRYLSEKDDLLPSGHYGLSKVLQEEIAGFYCRSNELDIIIARPFNITGPKEYPLYVCSEFTRQIVEIENGTKEPFIKVGNLKNRRDLTDVRDIVRGYELLASRGAKGETYNLCSGEAISIRSLLDRLLSMSKIKIQVVTSPEKGGSIKANVQVGDCSKMFSQTGWKPQIPLDRTLEDMLTYYRKSI